MTAKRYITLAERLANNPILNGTLRMDEMGIKGMKWGVRKNDSAKNDDKKDDNTGLNNHEIATKEASKKISSAITNEETKRKFEKELKKRGIKNTEQIKAIIDDLESNKSSHLHKMNDKKGDVWAFHITDTSNPNATSNIRIEFDTDKQTFKFKKHRG
jgi:hypothetical protein